MSKKRRAKSSSERCPADSYLQNHYHQPDDDLSQPFDWNAAARFARINWLLLREVADADERPRWYAGSFFGNVFAPKAPKAARH
jgi:hypothetical protein